MSEELYKRYRPRTLNGVLGNEATKSALSAYLEKGTLPHTLLFHGPSGCGKTTLARILAKQLNCSGPDFAEINCADFRGVDTARDIMRKMIIRPLKDCRVWLIDECHKLTNDAQNALLKALEDTPEHVYFFLCTTEHKKLLKTIRTRCTEMPVDFLSDGYIRDLIFRTAIKEKETAESDDFKGKIAKVVRQGYRYVIDEENIKVVRTAQVKLFG